MHGGRLSAAEKGKQMAPDDEAADLPPALVLPRRPVGDAAAANWHAGGGSGVPLARHLLVPPSSGTSEIEEAPPSPPPAPHLPARCAAEAAAAAVAGLEGRVTALQAALGTRLLELKQVRQREREGEEASKLEPEVGGAEAAVQVLLHQLGTVLEAVSGTKDTMLALRLRAEEMQVLEEFWEQGLLGKHQ